MRKTLKENRTRLILVASVTLLAIMALWYNLIRYQQENLRKAESQKEVAERKLSQMQDTLRHSKELEASLNTVSNSLAAQEKNMASGDLYASMINTLKKFKLPYKVDMPQFSAGVGCERRTHFQDADRIADQA